MYKKEKGVKNVVGDNIRRLMDQRGWSFSQVGKMLGVSGAAVNNWARGVNLPEADKIEDMCRVFNVERWELLIDSSSIDNMLQIAARRIPIIGTICAGDGIVAEQNIDGYFSIDRTIYADFALRVQGDSMIGAQIYPGDIAFLRKNYYFRDGEIYGVVFGNENIATLKRVFKTPAGLRLVPCNESYSTIEVDQNDPMFIVGELVGVYHPR